MIILGSRRFIKGPTALRLMRRGGGAPSGPDFSAAVIGDEIGGGVYAGIAAIGGTNYHIISGKAESESTGEWKTSQTTTTGTDSVEDGLANTLAMQSAGLASHPAAQHCINYAGGGFSDWHLPAYNQVNLLYANLRNHPEFSANVGSSGETAYTWTSTQTAANSAWIKRFSDGAEINWINKTTIRRVRPIRRVPV